jgi:hypothetical protein
MKTFYLNPINGRKSFNNKARVEQEFEISYLYSYDTKVAHYNHDTNKMTVNGYYSLTTGIHINAFLDFYGFDNCTKKELENYNN